LAEVNVEELTESHLGKQVTLVTPFEQIKGVLTDFYGSLDDEDEAIVVIEIDDEPYVCDEIPTLTVHP
jgi:hypothetical protein